MKIILAARLDDLFISTEDRAWTWEARLLLCE